MTQKKKRGAKGVTIAQMAFEMGMSPKYLKKLGKQEASKRYLDWELKQQVANAVSHKVEKEIESLDFVANLREKLVGVLDNFTEGFLTIDFVKLFKDGDIPDVKLLQSSIDLIKALLKAGD